MAGVARFAVLLMLGVTGLLWSTRPAVHAEESLDEQRARIEGLDHASKERLMRRLESYQAMTADQQERLRRLHQQIEQDPQAAELRRVMEGYHAWLKTLKPFQKAELMELPPRERIERIKRLKQEQARKDWKRPESPEQARAERLKRLLQEPFPRAGKRLSQEDLDGVLHWVEPYMTANESRLLDELPVSQREELRQQLAGHKEPERRRETLALVWLLGQMTKPGKLPALTAAEAADLVTRLSPATRQQLQALSGPERQRIVAIWLRLTLLYYVPSQYVARLPSEVSEQELADVLERKLNPGYRDWLLTLPPEELQRELWAFYLRSKIAETGPPNRPAGPKPAAGGVKPQRPWWKKAGGQPPRQSRGAPPRSRADTPRL
jgi:hypothetical protein